MITQRYRKGRSPRGFSANFWAPVAFSISIVGYYSLAGLANAFSPESNIGGILIRALVSAVVIVAWLVCLKYRDRVKVACLIPGALFLLFYLLRMYENAFIDRLTFPPSNQTAFLIFLLSVMLPTMCISAIVWRIQDNQLDAAMTILIGLFAISMALNLGDLVSTAENRMALDKINPISMSMTAFCFLLYHLLSFGRSKRWMLQTLLVVPLLLLVIVYARSRGVYIAGALTLFVYGLSLKGTRRIAFVTGFGLLSIAAVTWFARNEFAIVLESLQRILSGNDLSAMARRDSYSGGWNQFLEDPFLGRYILELGSNYYSHNLYLESLMAVGVVGTAFLAVHLLLALRAVFGIIRSSAFPFVARFVSVLFIFQAVIVASSGAVYLAGQFWLTSFMVIAFWYGKPDRRYSPQRPA